MTARDPRAGRPEAAQRAGEAARPEVRDGARDETRDATIQWTVVRLVAAAGVVGLGTAIGAVLFAADVSGWLTGLIVAAVSLVLTIVVSARRT